MILRHLALPRAHHIMGYRVSGEHVATARTPHGPGAFLLDGGRVAGGVSPPEDLLMEADERGLVYLADRANSGLHIVRLTGEASRIAGGN
jgi:hypothetical protein